jgi:hypothetical protein
VKARIVLLAVVAGMVVLAFVAADGAWPGVR